MSHCYRYEFWYHGRCATTLGSVELETKQQVLQRALAWPNVSISTNRPYENPGDVQRAILNAEVRCINIQSGTETILK